MALILTMTLLLGCQHTIPPKPRSQSTAVQAVNNSAPEINILDDIYTSIENGCTVKISGFSACSYDLTPKNTNETVLKIIELLKNSVPYNGIIPKSPDGNFVTNGYFGPKFLIMDTDDGHHINIQPACYYIYTESQNGNERYAHINYVTNVVQVNIDNKTDFITSKNFFDWFQDDEWKSEFNQIQ